MAVISRLMLFFLCISFMSCKKKVHDRICTILEEELKNNDSLLIKLDSVTDFSWDTLYVFWDIISRENVKSGYNIEIKSEAHTDDDGLLLVFTKNRKSVYEEEMHHDRDKCYFEFTISPIPLSKTTLYSVCKIPKDPFIKSRGNYYKFRRRKQ